MKIIFFEVPKAGQSIFLQSFSDLDTLFFEEKLTEDNVTLAQNADIISVFTGSSLNKDIIDKIPNLKFIATRSTGFDHIDCEAAKARDIKISNVPAYGSHTVAEFAFGLILNLSRNISDINNYLRESADFNYLPWMEGFNLEGKTIGVIGTGKIGKNVIKIAKGFEMNILAFDLFPDLNFAKENNFMYKSFEDVVSQSDIITLHTPYTKENHHLINRKNISTMKKGVCLVNTARGELVDTEALVEGLKNGVIAGAGLDVLENENDLTNANKGASDNINTERKNILVLNQELMKMSNVIITPHVAFFTKEAVIAIQETTVENIKGFISGSPMNLIK